MSYRLVPLHSITGHNGLLIDGDWVESKDQDPNGDVRLIQLADIGVGNFLSKSNRFMTSEKAAKLKCTYLEAGDILIARMPEPLGRACQFPGDKRQCVTVVDVCILRPDPQVVDFSYITHLFNSSYIRQQLDQYTKGTTRQRISRTNLEKILIPFPPLAEQRRIAAILDQADALRAKRRQTLTQLDEMARAIFVDMFGLPKKKSSKWPLRRLSDFCSPKQWPTITSQELLSEGYPVFGANGVIGHYSEYNHAEPTVLITCRGATCGTINISFPKSYVTGNSMALDDPDPNSVDIHYLAAALKERGLEDAISGSAQPQITRQSLDPVQLPIPPIGMQRDFSLKIRNLQNTRETLLKDAGKLDTLFASLQHRAFRGEL